MLEQKRQMLTNETLRVEGEIRILEELIRQKKNVNESDGGDNDGVGKDIPD